MTVRPRALIAFASTSGSTREVARLAANALPGMEVVLLDLSDPGARSAAPAGQRYDLVVAGTPS
jgi:menaquinone-dependent protoporphyrinogen IX oxidase